MFEVYHPPARIRAMWILKYVRCRKVGKNQPVGICQQCDFYQGVEDRKILCGYELEARA
jgi:hypothetical protein